MKKDRFAKPPKDPRANRGSHVNREAYEKGLKQIDWTKKKKGGES